MDKIRKLELIQRSLALRHKLKVHESMEHPQTHEDLAIMLLTKWEYEDELNAIEGIIAQAREENMRDKQRHLEKEGPKIKADTRKRMAERAERDAKNSE